MITNDEHEIQFLGSRVGKMHGRCTMTNSVADPNHAATLAAMHHYYDTELAAFAPNLAPGHGYENYSNLFSRTIPWDQKAALEKGRKRKGGEDGTATKPKEKRKASY